MEIEVVIPESGKYGDGPLYLRIHRGRAGAAWPMARYGRVLTGPLAGDREHDYVPAENSHSAHVRRRWLCEDGVPGDAVTVVRLSDRPVRREAAEPFPPPPTPSA